MSDQFTREDVTTLLLEVMDWTYVQATRDRPMTDAEKKVIDDMKKVIDGIRAHLAAPRPEPESKTPAWWMDGLTATLMREGVNKHRAREIAKGYWEAYCQIEEDKT